MIVDLRCVYYLCVYMWFNPTWLDKQVHNLDLSVCVCVWVNLFCGRVQDFGVREYRSKCVLCVYGFLDVGLNVCEYYGMSQSANFLLSSFHETFHEGLRYPPLPTPAQKWCSAFAANPCFLNWLHSLGKQNTFYRQAWETPWQNKQQTASTGTEMLITSVLFFHLIPRLNPVLSVIVYNFVLAIFCCSVWMFRSFPWVLMGKRSCQHFI